jgi:hypothetical protein
VSVRPNQAGGDGAEIKATSPERNSWSFRPDQAGERPNALVLACFRPQWPSLKSQWPDFSFMIGT